MYFCLRVLFLALIFRSMIRFELIFKRGVIFKYGVQIHYIACRYPVSPKPFVEKNYSFPHWIVLAFSILCNGKVKSE